MSWVASATVTSYTLQQRLGTGSWSTVYTGAATGSTRTVTATGSYTYQVQACNASGCSAYKASSAVAVTIAPASASALTVPVSSSTGNYTVSWGAVTGATSYTLHEQVNAGGWTTIQTGAGTSKALSGKGNGTYGYRAQACNAGGCGPWSGTATITVTLVPAIPAKPGVSASGPSYRPVVSVSWVAVAGATSYQVEGNHPDDGVSIYYNGPNTSFSQLIFATGPMTFRVKACNAIGCSGWSSYGTIMLYSGL